MQDSNTMSEHSQSIGTPSGGRSTGCPADGAYLHPVGALLDLQHPRRLSQGV